MHTFKIDMPTGREKTTADVIDHLATVSTDALKAADVSSEVAHKVLNSGTMNLTEKGTYEMILVYKEAAQQEALAMTTLVACFRAEGLTVTEIAQ